MTEALRPNHFINSFTSIRQLRESPVARQESYMRIQDLADPVLRASLSALIESNSSEEEVDSLRSRYTPSYPRGALLPEVQAALINAAASRDWLTIRRILKQKMERIEPNFIHPQRVEENIRAGRIDVWDPQTQAIVSLEHFPLELTKYIRGPKIELATVTPFRTPDCVCVDGAEFASVGVFTNAEFVDAHTGTILTDEMIAQQRRILIILTAILGKQAPENLTYSENALIHCTNLIDNPPYEIGSKIIGKAKVLKSGPWYELVKSFPKNQEMLSEGHAVKAAVLFSPGAIIKGT